MAYFASLCKARIIEKFHQEYVKEKNNSILESNTNLPKDSGQKWRMYDTNDNDTIRKMSTRAKKMFPEGSRISNLLLYLKTDKTFPNFVLKTLIGFFSGILLTYLCYMFFVFQLSISFVHATIMSSIIGVLLTLGLAFSYRMRCLVFLLLPQFFSRIGRYTLTCYALILILTGPATNTLRNSEVLTESMACCQEQIKTDVRHLTDSAKAPLNAIKDSVHVILDKIKQVNAKIDDMVQEIERLVISTADVIQSSYNRLHTIINTCNEKLGTPYEHCIDVIKSGIPDCKSTLGAKLSWLCDVKKVQSACDIVKAYREVCVLDEFAKRSFSATIRRKLREFTGRVKMMFYASMQVHHRFTVSGNESQSASQLAAGIVTEIRNRADPLLTWLSWSSCVTSLFLLLIIFRAKYYQHMYETRSRFDNCYVTKELYELDWKRFQERRDTILPLNRRERSKYIPTTSFRLVNTEKVFLSRSAVFMAITTFKLMIHMVADYSLYWVLMTIRHHGRLQAVIPPGPPDAGAKVTGSGFGADLLRSILHALTVPLRLPASSPVSCLPDPHPPDFQRYTQIGVLIILLWLFALFEPYGLRLRHVIMGHYRPERAKARAAWLYNHILRTRGNIMVNGSFMKLARRKVHREYKYGGNEHLTFRHWLDSHIPCYFLRRLLGTLPKESHCLLCETIENSKDGYTQLIRCETSTCPGLYCSSCFTDIGELCTICLSPADYGDYSDISLERGSSDDDSDEQYDTNECKDDSSKDYLKLRLIKLSNNNQKRYRKTNRYLSYYSNSRRDDSVDKTPLLNSFADELSEHERKDLVVEKSRATLISKYDVRDTSIKSYPVYATRTRNVRYIKNKPKFRKSGTNYSKYKFIRLITRYCKSSRYKLNMRRIKYKTVKRKRIHACKKTNMRQFYNIISKYLNGPGKICGCISLRNVLRRKRCIHPKEHQNNKIPMNLHCSKEFVTPCKLLNDKNGTNRCDTSTANEFNHSTPKEEVTDKINVNNKKRNNKENKKGKKKTNIAKNTPAKGKEGKVAQRRCNYAKAVFVAFSTCLCFKNKLTMEKQSNNLKKLDGSFQKQKNNFKRRKKGEKLDEPDENINVKEDNIIARNYRLTTYLQDQCWNKGNCSKNLSTEMLTKECVLDDLANLRMMAARNRAKEAEILKMLKDSLSVKAKQCHCPHSFCICTHNQGTLKKTNKPRKKRRSFFKSETNNIFKGKRQPNDVCCKYVGHATEMDQAVSTSFPEIESNLIKVHEFDGKPSNKATDPYSPRRLGFYRSIGKEFGKIGDGLKLYNFVNDTKICEKQHDARHNKGRTDTQKYYNKMATSLKSVQIKNIKLVLSERFLHIRIKNPAPVIKDLYKHLIKSRRSHNSVQYANDAVLNKVVEGGKTLFPVVQSSSCQYAGEKTVQDRGVQMRHGSSKFYCDAEAEVIKDTCTCATQCRTACVDKSCGTDAGMKTSEFCNTDNRDLDSMSVNKISSDGSTSANGSSSTFDGVTDDTKTDTTICSRVAIDVVEEAPIRRKINKHVRKIKLHVVTKTNQGTGTDATKLCDVSTVTDDWWSPIVERKPIRRKLEAGDDKTRKLKQNKCVSTDRHRIVKFLSRAQIIPREDVLSPSRYLLESQKYYNELFSSTLFAPHVYPVLVTKKKKEKLLSTRRCNSIRKRLKN